jgi:hypothetical protein
MKPARPAPTMGFNSPLEPRERTVAQEEGWILGVI